jgi:hypothetical protein
VPGPKTIPSLPNASPAIQQCGPPSPVLPHPPLTDTKLLPIPSLRPLPPVPPPRVGQQGRGPCERHTVLRRSDDLPHCLPNPQDRLRRPSRPMTETAAGNGSDSSGGHLPFAAPFTPHHLIPNLAIVWLCLRFGMHDNIALGIKVKTVSPAARSTVQQMSPYAAGRAGSPMSHSASPPPPLLRKEALCAMLCTSLPVFHLQFACFPYFSDPRHNKVGSLGLARLHFSANPVVHSVVCLRRLQLPCHPPETHREPSLCMLCIVFWSTSSWG